MYSITDYYPQKTIKLSNLIKSTHYLGIWLKTSRNFRNQAYYERHQSFVNVIITNESFNIIAEGKWEMRQMEEMACYSKQLDMLIDKGECKNRKREILSSGLKPQIHKCYICHHSIKAYIRKPTIKDVESITD